MSDTHLNYEYDYDDFDDDESADENNNNSQNGDRDSGMYENGRHARDDSFDTDLEIKAVSKPTKKSPGKPKTLDPYKRTVPSSRRAQSDPRGRKPPRRPGGGNSKVTSARSTVSNQSSSNDVMISRVLSANRKKASSLHNTIHELRQQCEELQTENKDLKRNIRLQDKDLRKFEGEEAELPMIMKRYNSEINVLQDKYKKQKEMSTNLTENLKRADVELLKTKDKLKEFQAMAKEKNLGERIELKNKVLDLQYTIEERDGKIAELNRAMLLQKKTHNRALKEKNEKYEKAMLKMKDLEQAYTDLQARHGSSLDVNNTNSRRKVKDEKQLVLSPQNPISPLLKKLDEETASESSPGPKLLLLTENKDAESIPVKTSVGDRIDTMVNRTEMEDSTDQSEVEDTFLTQGKMAESEEDFYDVNNERKDNNDNMIPTTTTTTTKNDPYDVIDPFGFKKFEREMNGEFGQRSSIPRSPLIKTVQKGAPGRGVHVSSTTV